MAEKLAAFPHGDFDDPTEAMEEWLGRSSRDVRQQEQHIAEMDREVNQARLAAEKMKEQHTTVGTWGLGMAMGARGMREKGRGGG